MEYLFAVQVEDIVTETKDISIGGLMCKINKYFKPKSIVSTTFILPCYAGERVHFDKIHCRARVVRCEPYPEIDDPDCHVMGLEFVKITSDQKAKISKFVRHSAAYEKKGKRSAVVSVKITPH